MTRTLRALVLGASLALLTPVTASAQEESPAESSEFQRITQEANEAYTAGNYDRAVALFEQAFELKPVSNILYNIARIHEDAGNIDAAISYYDRFVVAPNVEQNARRDALDRLKTLREIKEMREAEARAETEASTPPEEVAQPTTREPRPLPDQEPEPAPEPDRMRTLGWVLVGVGGASLVGSGITGLLAQSSYNRFEDAGTLDERRTAARAGRTQSVVADTLLITGLVTGVVGGVLLVVTSGGGESATASNWSLSPMLGSHAQGVAFDLRF